MTTLNRRAFLSSTAVAGPALLAGRAAAAPTDTLRTLFDTLYEKDLRSHIKTKSA